MGAGENHGPVSEFGERYDRDWFPEPVGRFVAAVEGRQTLKSSEFAWATPVLVYNLFRDAGDCRFDSGMFLENGSKIALLFFCKSEIKEQGISVFMKWDGEKILGLDALANEITPDGEN